MELELLSKNVLTLFLYKNLPFLYTLLGEFLLLADIVSIAINQRRITYGRNYFKNQSIN